MAYCRERYFFQNIVSSLLLREMVYVRYYLEDAKVVGFN